MKMHNDAELMAFSEIAYVDLDSAVEYYKSLNPDVSSISLKDIEAYLQDSDSIDHFNAVKNWVGDDYKNWSIPLTWNDEGPGGSGLYGCIIETSSDEPKDAVIAFRGSTSIGSEDGNADWANNLSMPGSEATAQDEELSVFLHDEKVQNLLNQYGTITTDGHSLGGYLADSAAVELAKMGLDSKLVQCANLDGPGHFKRYINDNKEAIEKVESKMTHVIWSRVGNQGWNISGKEQYVECRFNTPVGTFAFNTPIGFLQHDRKYPAIESKSFVDSDYYEWYCKTNDIGHRSRLIDDYFSITGHKDNPFNWVGLLAVIAVGEIVETGLTFAKEIVTIGEGLYQFGKDVVNSTVQFGKDIVNAGIEIGKGVVNVGAGVCKSIYNWIVGEEEHEPTIEEQAKAIVADSQGFWINPVTMEHVAAKYSSCGEDIRGVADELRKKAETIEKQLDKARSANRSLLAMSLSIISDPIEQKNMRARRKTLMSDLAKQISELSLVYDQYIEAANLLENSIDTVSQSVSYMSNTAQGFIQLEEKLSAMAQGW